MDQTLIRNLLYIKGLIQKTVESYLVPIKNRLLVKETRSRHLKLFNRSVQKMCLVSNLVQQKGKILYFIFVYGLTPYKV